MTKVFEILRGHLIRDPLRVNGKDVSRLEYLAQALSSAGLVGEVDEYKLKKLIFPYVAKCWLPELEKVTNEIKSAIENKEIYK